MKTRGFTIKLLAYCSWFVTGSFVFSQNTFAQSCPTYSWPTISAAWSLGPDNYYTAGGVGGGAVAAGDACACPAVNVPGDPNCKIYIDGIALSPTIASCGGWIPFGFTIPDNVLPEGSHYAELRFTAYGCDREQDYASPSKTFFVDKTLPIVTLVKPEDNVVISTADLAVTGNISDSASKVGVASVQLDVTEGPCSFNRNFFGVSVTAPSINGAYCSSYDYTGEVNQFFHFCVDDIGTLSSYNIALNLRDYVDFSQERDCRFSVSIGGRDRVGNQAEIKNLSFTVDQEPPAVAINEPVVLSTGLHWSDPAIISGTAVDISDITSVWLTIKDEGTKKWWDGASWVASRKWFNGSAWVVATDIKVSASKSGTTNVSWEYAGLSSETMRSGIFTITAYARDKFGHVGHTVLSGKNRGKYALGEGEFTSVSLVVKEVENKNRILPDNPYSFTSKTGENNIFVSAEISPARLAGILNNYVMWNVYGSNAYSGKPDAPHSGNPSNFLVEIPPVAAMPLGRSGPMGYTVFPRIEYDYEDVHRKYYSPDHRNITQDNKDELRQQYIDMSYHRFDMPTWDVLQLVGPAEFADAGAPAYWDAGIEEVVAGLEAATGYGFSIVSSGGSGFRSPKHNQYASEAEPKRNSRHAYGRAADCHFYDENNNGSYKDDWEIIKKVLDKTSGIWYLPERVADDPNFDNGWFHVEIPAK